MTVTEPPRPERGRTAEERGPDESVAQQKLDDAQTWAQRLAAAANPRYLLSQAEGYPVGIKQFLQLCLVLIYPAWLLFVLLSWPIWLVCKAGEGVLWVLFAPVRAAHKRNNPEEYAAYQAEQRAKRDARRASTGS